MFQFIAHLHFLLKATNQHGVHSPFIYNYVTKCLYNKEKTHPNKSYNVVLKSIAYFKIKTAFVASEKLKKNITTNLNYTKTSVDFGYLNYPDLDKFTAINYHNNTMVFVDNIYSSKQTKETWEQIKLLKNVTVTVDVFYGAAVFFRKEQAKEHFKIRL
ncbi:MAG: hypothetical protein ABJD66_09285 [Cellulophaga sp.]|uniref:hypothetical protein n=1 Tax=Cellulophaga sp. TaxID=1972202 RepID=UPI003264F3D5